MKKKRIAWNKGLTKETDKRVAKYAETKTGIPMSNETKEILRQQRLGKPLSEEHRRRISESITGEKNPFYGKKHTKKTKDIIGKNNSGKLEDRFGQDRAKEIKAKISDSIRGEKNPFYGKHLTEEHKEKISKNHANMSGSNNPMYGKGYLIAGENNGSWNGGSSFGDYGLEWTDELRTHIRKRDKFVCQVCGKNGYIVHHIDYIKENNKETNLITTCNSCHGKTNFNKEYWQPLFEEKIKVIYGNN